LPKLLFLRGGEMTIKSKLCGIEACNGKKDD
jgi:hypothetical protein